MVSIEIFSQNTAAYSAKEQNERLTDLEDMDSPGMGLNPRTVPPLCYGRNMTFPRPASSCTHRHELPAIVTEGESCRLLAEVSYAINCTILVYHRNSM